MKTIGRQLIAKRKEVISRASDKSSASALDADNNEDLETYRDLGGRDLLSVLIKANMDEDLPHSQRMTDDEVLARMLLCSICSHYC